MKKLTAILLLSTFLFHAGGYYVVFWALRHQAAVEMRARLDADKYSESETVTLKIPLAIPYNGDSYEYQSITGEMEHNGEYLRLVKKKFVRDTLYVVAVKDHRQKELATAMTDFFKASNDLPSSSPTMKLLGNCLREFMVMRAIEPIASRGWHFSLTYDERPYQLIGTTTLVESPPPDHLL